MAAFFDLSGIQVSHGLNTGEKILEGRGGASSHTTWLD
jgi:hypothetical protein